MTTKDTTSGGFKKNGMRAVKLFQALPPNAPAAPGERAAGERKDYHYKAFKTPKEALLGMRVAARNKASMRWDRVLILGFLAGAYIALGAVFSITVGGALPVPTFYDPGSPAVTSFNSTTNVTTVLVPAKPARPGVQRLLMGMTFPVGLMLVAISGAELFTGNVMFMTIGVLGRSSSLYGLARNWVLSYIGNFVGSIFVAGVLVYGAGLFNDEPYLAFVCNLAHRKTYTIPFHQLFLRGIGCNWLVCLSLWLALSAEDITGKLLSIWFCIGLFVTCQYEHSVANMFYIPTGVFYSHFNTPGKNTTFGSFIGLNLVPVTLGNLVGGVLFVAMLQTWCYGWNWITVVHVTARKFILGWMLGAIPHENWPKCIVEWCGMDEYGPGKKSDPEEGQAMHDVAAPVADPATSLSSAPLAPAAGADIHKDF